MNVQGQNAINSGKILEEKIEIFLKENDLKFSKNPPYTSIYNSKCKSDFVIQTFDNKDVRIECKYQGGGGSKDECIPYIFYNFEEGKFPENYMIIFLDWHQPRAIDAIKYLKSKAEKLNELSNDKKIFVVTSIDEFDVLINNL